MKKDNVPTLCNSYLSENKQVQTLQRGALILLFCPLGKRTARMGAKAKPCEIQYCNENFSSLLYAQNWKSTKKTTVGEWWAKILERAEMAKLTA